MNKPKYAHDLFFGEQNIMSSRPVFLLIPLPSSQPRKPSLPGSQ